MWSSVVVTCPHQHWCTPLENIFKDLKTDLLLVVPDPDHEGAGVGSGGATLNALLVVVEHLSARKGFTTLDSDLLSDSKILILHVGPSLLPLPSALLYVDTGSNGLPRTNVERIISVVEGLEVPGEGVVVAGTDILLHGELNVSKGFDYSGDISLFSVPSFLHYATQHGVAVSGSNSVLENILYQPDKNEIEKFSQGGMVNILSGLLWFSPKVAETLVKLHCLTPLDGCTYMGADSGETSLKISLYYDILTACCTQVSFEDFLIGNCGKTLFRGRHSSPAMVAARKHVWAEMREFRIVENVLKGLEHKYLPPWESLDESELITQWKLIHPYTFGNTSLVFRSGDSIIFDASIKDTSCKLVMGYTANLKEENSVMLNFCKDPVNIIYNVSGTLVSVIFSLTDKFFEPCNGHGGQLFGIPWTDALNQLNLTPEQVWANISDNFRTMYTAKLYRVNGELQSLEFITSNHDIGVSLATRSSLHQEMVCRSLEETGELINPTKYTDIFNLAVKDGWSSVLLQVLDKMALADLATKDPAERTSRLAFILAMTADLLGCVAKGEGGLRSGPANNKDFSHGFSLMEKGEYEDGLIALTTARSLWLDRPVRMVRAARHYEGVVQLLIRRTVMSAESQIMVDLSTAEARPDMEKEIKIQCPARLDLSGGWTDTPPICYELGGKVVDLAITLNGKKPIGCLVRRIPELQVEIVLDEGEVVFIRSHSDLENHCNPTAKGALVKCCLISAKLLSLESNDSVQVQLKHILGSGLRLKLWSELPQGSGLGTSSILAGAVVAGCWTAVGCRFSTSDVVHAVLVVEQLLTTGGGWQDQVGGLHPGFNLGTTPQDHNVSVSIQSFKPSPGFITALEKRLIVLYTGKPRLAKNLLQNVIRNWYSREPTIYQCFQDNYRLAGTCWEAVKQENINRLGDCLTEYWRIKRTLAPGAEPELVKNIFKVLEPYSVGGTLAGAGGGGFLTAILKEDVERNIVVAAILDLPGSSKVQFYTPAVDLSGMTVEYI